MFDQYGATEENVGDQGPSRGFGAGATGFDPSEIFKNIFTGGGGLGGFDIFGNGSGINQPEVDVAVTVNLSFLEAAKGATRSISFQRMESCASCGGKGVAKGSKMTTCRTCRGSGQVRSRGQFACLILSL